MNRMEASGRRIPKKYPHRNMPDKEYTKPLLTDFSLRFLGYLNRSAPDLGRLMHPAKDKEGRITGSLIAEIEAPNRHVGAPLSIATDDDEVTVGFDFFHAHFGNEVPSESEEVAFAKSIELVREIMAGHVLVASWWLDEKWSGSQLVTLGTRPTRPKYVAADAKLRLRSWTGVEGQEAQAS